MKCYENGRTTCQVIEMVKFRARRHNYKTKRQDQNKKAINQGNTDTGRASGGVAPGLGRFLVLTAIFIVLYLFRLGLSRLFLCVMACWILQDQILAWVFLSRTLLWNVIFDAGF